MGERRGRPLIGLSVRMLAQRADAVLAELVEALGVDGTSVGATLGEVREMVAEIRRVDRANRDERRRLNKCLAAMREREAVERARADRAESLLQGMPVSSVNVRAESFVLDVVYEPNYVVRTRVPDLLEAYQTLRASASRTLAAVTATGEVMDREAVTALVAELEAGLAASVPLEICLFVPDAEAEGDNGEPLIRLYRTGSAEGEELHAHVRDASACGGDSTGGHGK